MRVLYVDDDRINSLLFVEACRFASAVEVEVETAASGLEALEVAARWRPELLVIDLHLPDLSGHHLLPALRGLLAAPDLPAFLCTADDAALVEQPALDAGFTGCWVKPVDVRQLIGELVRLSGEAAAR